MVADLGLNADVSLQFLEFVSGLIIIGTILRNTRKIKRLTLGKALILLSGIVICIKQGYLISTGQLVAIELWNTFIFLLFALGISLFYKKNWLFTRK